MTLDNIEQSELTASQREVLAQAAEASKRLGAGAHLDDWLTLTPAVWIIRHLAMKLNHVNRPEGRGYAESFGQLMQRHGLHIFDKTTITALLWLDDDPERMRILREIREQHEAGRARQAQFPHQRPSAGRKGAQGTRQRHRGKPKGFTGDSTQAQGRRA